MIAHELTTCIPKWELDTPVKNVKFGNSLMLLNLYMTVKLSFVFQANDADFNVRMVSLCCYIFRDWFEYFFIYYLFKDNVVLGINWLISKNNL